MAKKLKKSKLVGLKIGKKKLLGRSVEQLINKKGLVTGFRFKGEKKFAMFAKFRKLSKFKQPNN